MYLGNTVLTRIKQSMLLLCTLVLISSCASQLNNVHRVQLDDNITYVLQPIPESLQNTGILAAFTVKQQGKEEEQLLMQVEMSRSRLLISGMTAEGLSLFSLDWHSSHGTLNVDKKIAIKPQRILAELQLTLWPEQSIAKGLEQGKFSVNDNQRVISALGEVIYQVTVHDGSSLVENVKHNYAITVEEIERWQLTSKQSTVEN